MSHRAYLAATPPLRRSAASLGRPIALLAVVAACGNEGSRPQPLVLPPGITFSYPRDGQVDIPVASRLLFRMTSAVDEASLAQSCALEGTAVRGAFCLVGPAGLVPTTVSLAGPDRNILLAEAAELTPGATYRVFVRPELLAGASNLPTETPLVTFRARLAESSPGPATLLAINGEPPEAFAPQGAGPRLPVLDRTTLRLVFSEALDELSATSATVLLRRTGTAAPLAATLLARGQHLVVDPDTDLTADVAHELVLAGLADRSGTPVAPLTLTFTPKATKAFEQLVELDSPGTPAGPSDVLSELTGVPVNSVDKHAPLIGSATLGLLPGQLRAELGDPSVFGGPIPFTVRKGQSLGASELPLRLAGIVGLGYQTGNLRFEIVSDANGWVTRNRHRPADTRPDDRDAPLAVELFLDAALIAEDANGNAMATQTLLGLHLVGAATSAKGQLALEVAGALEVELLGVARSHADLSLRLRTGAIAQAPAPNAPQLLSAWPANGQTQVATDVRLQLVASSAIDAGRLRAPGQLALAAGANPVAIDVAASGGAITITPRQALAPATTYTLTIGALQDVAGQALALRASDPSGGTGRISFTTAPTAGGNIVSPQVAAALPGVPCALTGGASGMPGRCVNGAASDPSYQPFELAADRPIEVWFTQPMAPASLRVGTTCNNGAIRIEELTAAGACVRAVPGDLRVRSTSFRFTPTTRLTPGVRYRVVLVAGNNDTCNAGEICGANDLPLNTTQLNSIDDDGGPNIELQFVAKPPAPHTVIPLTSLPLSDRNGNGYIDTGEVAHADNRLGVDVAGTSGIITAASLRGPDCFPALPGNQVCIGVSTELPVTVLPKLDACPLTATGAPAADAGPCVPVRVSAQSVRVTSLTIDASATLGVVEIDIRNVQTGMMHLRVLEPTAAGAVGYILDDGAGKPVFVIKVKTLMDAPNLSIFPGISHDVDSKPVDLTLAGPVTFLPDGRMRVELRNLGNVIIPVNVSPLVGPGGRIDLRVPDRTLTLSLVTPPIR